MSKSLNLFVPAVGAAALVLGVAYGVSSRDYGARTIETLETRVIQSEQSAARALEKAQSAAEMATELATERDALQELAAQAAVTGGGLTTPAPENEAAFGLGRVALPEELASWDVDVLPDGRGLPEGSGDVFTGEEVFVAKCASCHGDFAEGVGNWPVLAGGFDTLADADPVKTVGSYWPYLSTVWDYIHRSMPFGEAGTLSADETYSIVAYILYSNDLVDDDFELNRDNFTDVEMHNAEGFVRDDRAALEYADWRAEPCMSDCKDSVEITMRATFLDVTPDGEDEAAINDASADDTPVFTATTDAAATGPDPALVAAGEAAFRQCKSCHQVGDGAVNRTGPQLNGVVGRVIGGIDGFRYSAVFAEAADAGQVWNPENLAAFLADPRGTMSGTKMSFRGVSDPDEIAALIAYIDSFAQ